VSKELLTNYTPAMDVIVKELGAITALVYGRVWRYCQGEYEECFASQSTIAADLGLSRKTVNEHLELLVKAGYLTVTDKAGVTKTYRDTGKILMDTKIRSTTCNPKLQPPPEPVTQSYNPNAEPVTQSYNPCNLKLQVPVTLGYTKIDIKKESKREVEYVEGDPDDVFPRMQHLCERLIGRLSTPADIPTIEVFLREGITEEDIQGALAWRVSQKLKPAANIRQLEAGVLRNKAARVQAASAASKKPSAKPTTLSDALKRLEGEIHVPEESSEIPSGPHSRLP
jgi:hypothetical protein